jgi:hypothetical protein
MRRKSASVLLYLCLIASRVQAAPAGVSVSIRAQPELATVGDPIVIELEIQSPPELQISIKPPGQTGKFTVLDFVQSPPEPPLNGVRQVHARITVSLFETGEFEFPPLPIEFRRPDGGIETASSPPVKVRIRTVLDSKDLGLRPLKRQAELKEPFPWARWLAVSLGVLLLAAVLWYGLRRRKSIPTLPVSVPIPPANPLDMAESKLRDLIARDLIARGMVKHFYVEFSEIVRAIVAAGYGVRTAEDTTSEILAQLRSGVSATPPEIQSIDTLLSGCDLAKFAKYVPSASENSALVQSAFDLLLRTRKREARSGSQS